MGRLHGIRVNAMSAGPVDTPMQRKPGVPAEKLQAAVDATISQIPLQRFGEPREIAKTVVFLASDESLFMVGSEMIIDGGMSTL